ncbi:trichohyalin, putative [Entamoeba histolytica]
MGAAHSLQEENHQVTKERKRTEEIHQIEEWTEKRITNILFDSDKDDWNRNTSVFDQRIWNKEDIIIIIEDSEGNIFGGYVHSKIDKYDYIYDSKSFLFSLESNGRLEGMMKFDIKMPEYTFWLFKQSHHCLFSFGCGADICVYKENNKTKSFYNQFSFEYEGTKNALCGKGWFTNCFTPKRIIVVQMK